MHDFLAVFQHLRFGLVLCILILDVSNVLDLAGTRGSDKTTINDIIVSCGFSRCSRAKAGTVNKNVACQISDTAHEMI